MKKTITTINGFYSDPVWEKEILAKHKEYQKSANNWGMVCAVQNTVKDDTPLPVVTETIYRNYDTLISASNQKLDGTLGIAHAKLSIDKLELENDVLSVEAVKLKNKHEIEKSKLGFVTIPKAPYRQIFLGIIISLFILFFDTYMVGSAFQSSGSGLGMSIILGLSISITITILSILGTAQIEKLANWKHRLIWYVGLFTFIGLSVYVLCEMRSYFFHSQTGQDMSAAKMMLLNLLAFASFHLIYKYILAPAFEKLKERSQAKMKLQQVTKIKDEILKIEKQIANNQDTIVNTKHLRLSVLSYAKTLEDTICKYYKEAIAEFKKAFMEKAGYVPYSFNSEPPELNRFYSEHSIIPNAHEKVKPLTTIIILLALALTSCDKIIPTRTGNSVGIVVDITDSLQVINEEFTIDKLKPLFAVSKDYNASSRCVLATITDLRYTEVSISSVEDDSYFSSNIIQRDTLIKSFFHSVKKNIGIIKHKPIGTKGSFVIYAIAKMLNDIATSPIKGNKKVIVFSDLAENTSVFNIYRESDRQLLEKNPKALYKLFDKEYPLPNLKGIEIILINRPGDTREDEQYHLLSQTLKTYYQERGAQVVISASIPNGA